MLIAAGIIYVIFSFINEPFLPLAHIGEKGALLIFLLNMDGITNRGINIINLKI